MFEILGLAGSGKSTAITGLQSRRIAFVQSIRYAKIGPGLFKQFFRLLQIFLLTQNSRHLKEFITYEMLLQSIKKKCGEEIVCFDQGPLFVMAKLIMEIPQLEVFFIQELQKVFPYYKEVIYLEAPLEVLTARINAREQLHRIKNKSPQEQHAFLKNYIRLYEKIIGLCRDAGINVVRINTQKHGIDEVAGVLSERIHNR
jgi:thymidylate kinase